ncbi:MAG: ATP-binding cassette domain-containing protein [Chloroflexi bacterium]|nr:ATP-binding cassette domain-containing protein [Chloroflexota bacterium]
MPAITAEGLVKIYRSRHSEVHALDGVDLVVEEGTVLGLLGPNGAGKTTMVRILTTLLRPDAGHATVAGFDIVREAQQLRSVIGLSGQYAAVDENLTARENLWMFGRLYQLNSAESRKRAGELLEQFDLIDAADRVVKTYSGGMRRRLDLASALIGRPRLLFLDEPTYLEEADELADTIAVIDRGKVIARGTADELKSQVGGERIEVVVHDRAALDRAEEILARDGSGQWVLDEHTRKLTVPATGGAGKLIEIVRDLGDAGIAIDDIALRRPTLDDVFLALTGRASSGDDEAAA